VRGSASEQERQERIAEIEEYLDKELRIDGSNALLLVELGQLHRDLGNPSAALSALERALAIYRETDDRRQAAMARGLMADIEATRGNTDEAIQTYEEILKVFEELGDVRERAVTLGRIADVYQARGQWDEALRIRQEEQLPVYERLQSARDLLVCRAEIGINYLRRNLAGDRQKALELLNSALQDARRLNLPEARQIAEIIRQA
jgi:tetratricopeptide (TPR) repeat protein